MTEMHVERRYHLRPDRVIRAFAEFRGIEEAVLLHGSERTRAITALRHELMWLLHDLTDASHATIGQIIGGRDGSTVWEAIQGVADRLATDTDYRIAVRAARRRCVEVATAPSGRAIQPIGDGRSMAARMIAAASVLRDGMLSDSDARTAALQILTNAAEAPRG